MITLVFLPAAAQYAYAPAPGTYPAQHHDPSAYAGTYAAVHQAVPQGGSTGTYESYAFGYDPTQVCPLRIHWLCVYLRAPLCNVMRRSVSSVLNESYKCFVVGSRQPSARMIDFAEPAVIFRRH